MHEPTVQAPETQRPVPWFTEHTAPVPEQLPQWLASVFRLISQPSMDEPLQSAKPGLQVNPHDEPLQVAMALDGAGQAEHELPHVAVLVFSTHAPEHAW